VNGSETAVVVEVGTAGGVFVAMGGRDVTDHGNCVVFVGSATVPHAGISNADTITIDNTINILIMGFLINDLARWKAFWGLMLA
jgi:hypothetical protein